MRLSLPVVCALLLAAARPVRAECAREGQGLIPATDQVSPKQLERTARALMGNAVARIVRTAPWQDTWVGDFLWSQPTLFIQGFDRTLALPTLRLPIAAPPPFVIEASLEIDTARNCVAIDVPQETSEDDGIITVRAPITATVTIAIGGLTEAVKLNAAEASVSWHRVGRNVEATLHVAGLQLSLGGSSAILTAEAIRDGRELAVARDLLVRSLGRSGSHRTAAVTLLSDLGIAGVSGDSWVRLRQLQKANKLRASEIDRLDWLARRPVFVSDDDLAATFTTRASSTPPRLFIAGQEITGWTREGDRYEVRVGMTGLTAVRAEFSDGSAQAFVTVLDRPVRISLLNVWGPTLDAPPPGQRCGFTADGPASDGSIVQLGGVSLVPSMPGRYSHDRLGLHFDPNAPCP